jgi:hypothetical protein
LVFFRRRFAPWKEKASSTSILDENCPNFEQVQDGSRLASSGLVRRSSHSFDFETAPSSVEDFAFADTVATRDLDLPPPSGPIIVSDPLGHTHQMTPLAYPIPVASDDAHVETLRELWSATLHVVRSDAVREAPSSLERSVMVLRRMRALWQFWQWERDDVLRATMIGTAVFLAAALAWFASTSIPR